MTKEQMFKEYQDAINAKIFPKEAWFWGMPELDESD